MHSAEAQHVEQKQPRADERSSLRVSNATPREQGALWNHAVAESEDRRTKEQDTAWILPVLTSANNILSALSIYTAIKVMALFYIPNTNEYTFW